MNLRRFFGVVVEYIAQNEIKFTFAEHDHDSSRTHIYICCNFN